LLICFLVFPIFFCIFRAFFQVLKT
jgi:hypothetical protein